MMDSFLPLLDDFSMTSRNSSGSNCNDLLFRLSQEFYIVKLRAKSTSRSSSGPGQLTRGTLKKLNLIIKFLA